MSLPVKEDPRPAWSYFAETTNAQGYERQIRGMFKATDEEEAAITVNELLNKRLRKPQLWYGVSIEVSPIGDSEFESFEMVIEDDVEEDVCLEPVSEPKEKTRS